MAYINKGTDERRNELVASGQRLFFEKGYDKTSVNDIVKDVGVAKGLFYYYFDSKQALLSAVTNEIAEQAVAVMHQVVEDASLSALAKWERALSLVASWKTAQRDELMHLLRVMRSPENVTLLHALRSRSVQLVAPELAKIIAQGVEEAVFDTPYPLDSAEIIYTTLDSITDLFHNLLIEPDAYPDRLAIAQQKLEAIQTAIERILGAPPNSLPLLDNESLIAWFS